MIAIPSSSIISTVHNISMLKWSSYQVSPRQPRYILNIILECRSKSADPMEGFTCGNHPTVSVGSQVYIKQSKFNSADERITAILGQSKVYVDTVLTHSCQSLTQRGAIHGAIHSNITISSQ